MDAYKREQKIVRDIQLARSKINHLTQLMSEITEAIKKTAESIEKLSKEFKEFKENSQ